MSRLTGKRALITGASRGIGAALAMRLAAEGADVALVARTADKHDHLAGSLAETGERLAQFGGKVVLITADLSDETERPRIVPEAVAGLGGSIDILINNAAAAIYNQPSEFSAKRRRMTFEVNVNAPHDLVIAALPGMRARGAGWIINVSSGSTRPASGPPYPIDGMGSLIGVYGASKAALNRLTQALAQEFHGTGIRINTIEPQAAVMSEGAAALVGGKVKSSQVESMEEMVEGTLVLCDCDPDFTGKLCVTLDLISELGLTVKALDGGPITR